MALLWKFGFSSSMDMKLLGRQRFYFPEAAGSDLKALIFMAGIISGLAFVSVRLTTPMDKSSLSARQRQAAAWMQDAILAIRAHCDSIGLPIDTANDPNRTGLIGSEISPIATTLGNLEAKRTTTHPAFAAVIVHLLQQAGVAPGDTIAIGCSGSFPALMIATLAAARALSVHPIFILSLGSSSYGATNPDFNLLHIFEILYRKDIFSVAPRAVSLGGDHDVGNDFDPTIRAKLIRQIEQSGFELLYEPELEKNVAHRMALYLGPNAATRIAAFVNIGGNYANIGTSELVLTLKPGMNRPNILPDKKERGVIFEMASRGVPIIHLLYIKGMALSYGLAWDPLPLPDFVQQPGIIAPARQTGIRTVATIYLVLITGLLIYGMIRHHRPYIR